MTLSLPWLLLALTLTALLLAVIGWRRASTRVSRANRARSLTASRGEAEAEGLLEGLGYAVDDRQVSMRWTMTIDGEDVEVLSRADLLVSRRGECFVAEVKTGERAPEPTRPATRRQLMEYLHVFSVDGVLLVDMVHRRVRRVGF